MKHIGIIFYQNIEAIQSVSWHRAPLQNKALKDNSVFCQPGVFSTNMAILAKQVMPTLNW